MTWFGFGTPLVAGLIWQGTFFIKLNPSNPGFKRLNLKIEKFVRIPCPVRVWKI